jgi:hypothetical protein
MALGTWSQKSTGTASYDTLWKGKNWLVGGFNHLEKYESQWEGLSHIFPYTMENKKCLKPPTSWKTHCLIAGNRQLVGSSWHLLRFFFFLCFSSCCSSVGYSSLLIPQISNGHVTCHLVTEKYKKVKPCAEGETINTIYMTWNPEQGHIQILGIFSLNLCLNYFLERSAAAVNGAWTHGCVSQWG